MNRKKIFQFRAFVSLLAAFSFIMVAASGVILYLSPKGRIANWTNWTFWHLSKEQWASIHICITAVFILTCLVHGWLNIRPLINYFRKKLEHGVKFRYEWTVALLLCGLVFWGGLKQLTPFNYLLDTRENFKSRQEKPKEEPPIPHAEILTIAKLAQMADLDLQTVLNNLKANNIQASGDDVFGEVAAKQDLSPDELYAIAIGKQAESSRGHGGGRQGRGGFGQKTVRELCQDMDIPLPEALEALEQNGIRCTADQRIRNIADENNVHPSQIRQILENL